MVSDETFLRVYPQRVSGAPNHLFIQIAEGQVTASIVAALRSKLPPYDSQVRTIGAAIKRDQAFQLSQKPIGLIFGFGVLVGALVGVVIVYQVLATDVADHISEYATLKAIGYRHRFFLGVILEEAVILAVLGFIPGLMGALLLYRGMSIATGLPVVMTTTRALAVLFGTVIMCGLSGAVATRRLARANPAELF
ncbi:MAG: FtsX-like permease family protein [Myxococcota bacterium]